MNKSFLKWPGGKSRIAKDIDNILPYGQRLVEPFVGSASVFLNTDFDEYFLSDVNEDLINLYNSLKTGKEKFIRFCNSFFIYNNNNEDKYAELRLKFNRTKDVEVKSAIFLYLNKHCFNGICRYNSKGEFNTPFGKLKTSPSFPYQEIKYFMSKAEKAEFTCMDFREVFENLKDGDVIYCDPPYVPLSKTSSFTNYSSDGFSEEDQKDLAKLVSNCSYPSVISNHDTKFTRKIYKSANAIETINVKRSISCKGSKREMAKEIFAVFNIKREDRKSQKNLNALFGD